MKQAIEAYFKDLFRSNYGLKIDFSPYLSKRFCSLIENQQFHHNDWFTDRPLLFDEKGRPDYLGTCFYMIHSLQEYASYTSDHYGRFPFKESYQYRFGCVTENLVETYLETYFQSLGLTLPKTTSTIYLSHDIDSIYGGFRQDANYLFRSGQYGRIWSLVMNFISGERPRKNIDLIMSIEDEHDLKSTFYWIAEKKYDSHNGIPHADYDLTDPYIKTTLQTIEKTAHHENGLHKSTSEGYTFKEEIKRFSPFSIKHNRNHYLKFKLPKLYQDIQKSGLKTDSSLGFAETIGYRNSYGLPFRPFDLTNQNHYDFLEIPLHIMDTTFLTYQNLTPTEIEKNIIDFLRSASYNQVISILWHNDKLSPYKFESMLTIYKKLLVLIAESEMNTVTASDLYYHYYSDSRSNPAT